MDKRYIIIAAAITLLILTANPMFASAENLIKKWETGGNINRYLDAYLDPVGIPTIGFGSIYNYDAKRKVQLGDKIDVDTAIRWMRIEMGRIEPKIKALIKVPINNNQLNALISFVYNVGIGAFRDSTLLRLLNQGKPKSEVAAQFDRWIFGTKNGQRIRLEGLVRRRKDEKELFLS